MVSDEKKGQLSPAGVDLARLGDIWPRWLINVRTVMLLPVKMNPLGLVVYGSFLVRGQPQAIKQSALGLFKKMSQLQSSSRPGQIPQSLAFC